MNGHKAPGFDDLFSFLYVTNECDLAPLRKLGAALKMPGKFEHGKEVLIARLPKKTDGHAVKVYETRCPASFYRVVAEPTTDYNGKPKPGFEIGTGSGDQMGELAAQIAIAISEGMLGLHEYKSRKKGKS